MAGNNLFPRLGLLSQFDTRQWQGTNVFTRGSALTLSTNTPDTFEDAVAFLNGHCSYRSLTQILQTASDAAGAGLGTWTVGINDDDKVYIYSSTTASWNFTSVAGRTWEYLGFPAGTYTSSVSGTGSIITAPSDWIRGDFPTLIESINKSGITIYIPANGRVQDVPIYLRSTSEGDDDYQSLYHLQKQDNDALTAGTTNLVRWGINSKGHVFVWTKTGTTAISSWNSSTFRERLGFNGTASAKADTSVSEGGGDTLTAYYPLPGCIIPSRPYDACESISETFSNSVALEDGTISSNYISTHYRWFVRCYLDGPADAINEVTIDDLHRHWQYRCKPYLSAGAPCVLYQEWGDSRRASERGIYGLLYSNEQEGYRGRIIGWMAIGSPAIHQITWPQNLRRRSPLEFTIQQDPTTIS